MRVLGIDHGDRHVGLALSDPLLITAQPLGTYELTGHEKTDREYFQELVSRHGVGEIVIGDPLRMDGTSGTRVEKTRLFAAWLKKAVGKPVFFMDERLTTKQAGHILREENLRGRKKKSREDQVSAVIILSTYLERKRGRSDADETG
ncbi:MAG: Holliday junction resolvase RuvX [Candidatus Aminicenantes bacterium]|nr:Holliday junction resolvase RuvX [Candidatus Aminicenantes bacterium]